MNYQNLRHALICRENGQVGFYSDSKGVLYEPFGKLACLITALFETCPDCAWLVEDDCPADPDCEICHGTGVRGTKELYDMFDWDPENSMYAMRLIRHLFGEDEK